MKSKLVLLAISILGVINLSAQTQERDSLLNADSIENSNLKYRVELGYSQQFRYGDYTVTSPFHVIGLGMNVEYPIKWGIGVETGLRYSFAFGDRIQKYAHGEEAKFEYKAHWLSVPLKGTYNLPIFWDMTLFFYAGPTINIGLLHNEKIDFKQKTLDPEPDVELPYPVSNENLDMYKDHLKRVNILLGAGGGLEWKSFRLKSGYDWGLNNLSQNKDYPEYMKGWHISLEYEF